MGRILTVVYCPVDVGIRCHPHEGEVGEVHVRKRHCEGVVFVLRIQAWIQHKDGQVVRIFVKKE